MMSKQLLKDAFGWGFLLWIFGYVAGILFFAIVPPSLLGWFIMPLGTALALWVLFKKVKITKLGQYLVIAIVWSLMAMILDYIFLVRVFKPADGYYKIDVYVYYALTFLLPVSIGLMKQRRFKV